MTDNNIPASQPKPQDPVAAETRVVPATGVVEIPEGPDPDLPRAEIEAQMQRDALARAVQAPRTVADRAPITR